LHANLALAVKLPHERPRPKPAPIDLVVNDFTYAQALRELEASTLQHYPWMLELAPYRDFVARRASQGQSLESDLSELDDLSEELDDREKIPAARIARAYLKGLVYLRHDRWLEVIRNAEEGLKMDASAEPFLWQRALARQQLGQFNKGIVEMGAGPWRYFDHRRELLMLENTFLEGRYSDAAAAAAEYRRKYPFDIDGAFWQTLTLLRMRLPVDRTMAELEAFWGDRPMVRGLKIFYYGYLRKLDEARAAMDLKSDIVYTPSEWGILEFAQAWFWETFYDPRDDKADQLRRLAELHWPLARLVRVNMPREAVEEK
jgi:hypothetical protein